jgi:predicted nucleic acid-binding protein
MRSFFDTNVLVYLFDQDAPEKKTQAQSLLQQETARNGALISTQVLQEFYVAVTRKLAQPLPYDQATRAVRNLTRLPVVYVDVPLILAAMKTGNSFGISFWDALIVEAAREGGASYLYTEDLQTGQVINGVEVRNPFIESADA